MRISLKSLAIPIIFIILVFVALRAEKLALQGRGAFHVKPHPSQDNAVIFSWNDAIEAPMALDLSNKLSEWGEQTNTIIFYLNSPGGSLREGAKVIELIKQIKKTHHVEMRVRNNRICLSMCVPIYLQGGLRRAGASARFMFHEPRLVDVLTDEVTEQPEFERDWSSNRFFNRYFVNSEMEIVWREKLREAWKGKDVWYTGRELVEQRSGVVQELM